MKIYLAGDMHSGWQDELAAALGDGFDLIDPRNQPKTDDPEIYTAWDLMGIRESDAVVALMGPHNPSGYGLCVEAGYAHALGKPVVFIDLLGSDWRAKYFGMVKAAASSVVPSIAEAVTVIARLRAAP